MVVVGARVAVVGARVREGRHGHVGRDDEAGGGGGAGG